MKTGIFLKISFSLIILGLFLTVIFIALVYKEFSIELYFVLLLALIFTFLFSLAVGQRFVSPIKKLIRRGEELSKGSLKTRIYLETKDEFEELSEVFNQIAEELERSHSMVEKAENTVNIKVRARTKELEENIESLERKVKVRAKELQRMINEFEKFQRVGKERELEIIELKKALQKAQAGDKKLKEKLEKSKNEKEVKDKKRGKREKR